MIEILWQAVLGVAIALTCACAIAKVSYNIKAWRRRYKLQHRFDKPPLAKCYCVDCSHRSGEGRCDLADCYVDHEFFCKHASPR